MSPVQPLAGTLSVPPAALTVGDPGSRPPRRASPTCPRMTVCRGQPTCPLPQSLHAGYGNGRADQPFFMDKERLFYFIFFKKISFSTHLIIISDRGCDVGRNVVPVGPDLEEERVLHDLVVRVVARVPPVPSRSWRPRARRPATRSRGPPGAGRAGGRGCGPTRGRGRKFITSWALRIAASLMEA